MAAVMQVNTLVSPSSLPDPALFLFTGAGWVRSRVLGVLLQVLPDDFGKKPWVE